MSRLLTVKEAAAALRISEATVRSLISRKLIRHERIGLGRGKVMIPEDAIDEYRRSRTVEASGGETAIKTVRPRATYQNLKF